jgi:hypothetical protein
VREAFAMLPFRKFSANVADRLVALCVVASSTGRFHIVQHLRASVTSIR